VIRSAVHFAQASRVRNVNAHAVPPRAFATTRPPKSLEEA